MKNFDFKKIFALANFLMVSAMVQAGQGTKGSIGEGLTKATEEVSGIFNTACNLLYAVCAIMAIIGAFHVYSKWTSGDPDVTKAAAGWIGGLIFVGVATTIINFVFIEGN